MKRKLIYIVSIIVVNIIVFHGSCYAWFISLCYIHGAFDSFKATTMTKILGCLILLVLLLIWELINFGLYRLLFKDYKVNKMYIKVPMAIVLIFNLVMDILIIHGF